MRCVQRKLQSRLELDSNFHVFSIVVRGIRLEYNLVLYLRELRSRVYPSALVNAQESESDCTACLLRCQNKKKINAKIAAEWEEERQSSRRKWRERERVCSVYLCAFVRIVCIAGSHRQLSRSTSIPCPRNLLRCHGHLLNTNCARHIRWRQTRQMPKNKIYEWMRMALLCDSVAYLPDHTRVFREWGSVFKFILNIFSPVGRHCCCRALAKCDVLFLGMCCLFFNGLPIRIRLKWDC